MTGGFTDMLSFCSRVDFGPVALSREEEGFRAELNQEMLSLCEQLPESRQTEAVLFLMEYLQAPLGGGFNLINYFYPPSWSILFWLLQSCPDRRKLRSRYVKYAKLGHTMAMFLHAFDDHLTDGQLPVTHLALLMRSQSWMIMTQAYARLANGLDKGMTIVSDLIDNYYSSIGKSDGTKSLDGYCELFEKQMATWLVAPTLLAKRIFADEGFSRCVQSAYCSFGIAWRLLDDVQDFEKDMARGVRSSIYVCLNDELRAWWDEHDEAGKRQNSDYSLAVLAYAVEQRVIEGIIERVCRELESASSIADSCGMAGFADELRCLLEPLKGGWNRL